MCPKGAINSQGWRGFNLETLKGCLVILKAYLKQINAEALFLENLSFDLCPLVHKDNAHKFGGRTIHTLHMR